MSGLREWDRLLIEVERAAERARLALHAHEDSRHDVIDCMDTDGDGDCPRCVHADPRWTCARVAAEIRDSSREALLDAVHDAYGHAHALILAIEGGKECDSPAGPIPGTR